MNLLNQSNDLLAETASGRSAKELHEHPNGSLSLAKVVVGLDDAQLMQQVAKGNQVAFRILYERFADRLYRYALIHLRSPAAAEDAVQETLLAVWRHPTRYRATSSLSSFLFGICHHKVVDLLRSRSREQTLDGLPETAATQSDPEDRLATMEAIQSLPEEMRSVLILAFHVGLNYDEIARTLSIPVGTVKSRVFTARRRLQASLAGQQ